MNKVSHVFKNSAFVFMIPSLTGFTLFYLFPFLISIYYSLIDSGIHKNFVGLLNFKELLSNQAYLLGLKNTVLFIGMSVPLTMIIALWIAANLLKFKKHKDLLLLLFLIPLVIPSGSMAFFWQSFFTYKGYANNLLTALGFDPINFLETGIVRYVIVFIFIWKNVGYTVILFVSGLKNIPGEYYEAASIDGASGLKQFTHITLQCLIPTFILVIIMSIVNSFKVFKEIYMISGDYPHESIYTLQHFMNNMFRSLNYQKLTAATILLLIMMGSVVLLLFKFQKKVES